MHVAQTQDLRELVAGNLLLAGDFAVAICQQLGENTLLLLLASTDAEKAPRR